jgi:mono/diheme cytochrome c family protein
MLSRTGLAVLIIILFVAGIGGLVLAQNEATPEPEATDEPVDCSNDGITAAQAELDAQLEDFTALLETDPDAALETLFTVGEGYQSLALDCGYIPPDIAERFVGTAVENILVALEDLDGDPISGQLIYNGVEPAAGGTLGCTGCHSEEAVAPLTAGTWTRWDEIRSLEPQFADYTFEQFIVESIVLPWDYLAPGYAAVMPAFYSDQLSFQDLADIIAYLESQDQFLDE